jgi:hypothetical protein
VRGHRGYVKLFGAGHTWCVAASLREQTGDTERYPARAVSRFVGKRSVTRLAKNAQMGAIVPIDHNREEKE